MASRSSAMYNALTAKRLNGDLDMIRVGRLPYNTRGRDIVIGDLHGNRDLLIQLLEKVDLDPTRDRVISTGDLPDRGSDSIGCLELLFEPWFHAVRGNHDQHLLELIEKAINAEKNDAVRTKIIDAIRTFVSDGGMGCQWFPEWLSTRLDWAPLEAIGEALARLPHILVVGEGLDRYNVVHADLVAAGLASDARIDSAHGMEDDRAMQSLMWSRRLVNAALALENYYRGAPSTEVRNDLSPTFCGHTVVPRVMSLRQH